MLPYLHAIVKKILLSRYPARKREKDARISVGDEVSVTARDGMIVIAPVRRIRGKQSLQELVSRIPKDYEPKEVDWGKPACREVWQAKQYVPEKGGLQHCGRK